MDLQDLKHPWQQCGAPDPEWRQGEDVRAMRARLAALRRASWRRDLREVVSAIAVAAIFSWTAWRLDRPLARAGALVVAVSAIVIIGWMRMRGGRNLEPDAEVPVVQFFRRELTYLDRQTHLLRSVLWWYIGPSTLGVVLFFVGMNRFAPLTAALVLVALGVAALVYWLNLTAVRTVHEPLRDEVARLLHDLEERA